MARKSRVNNQVEISIPKNERISTAIYARLSVENSGKSEDKDVIRNQIEICKNYVDENPQFDLVETYIENGKTGTTFNRPVFNRLMEDIKKGKIKCLIVRDLSRFGRDYIETGTYLERIFPNIGLRFISIKERYDSFTVDTTNEALMIPLQNMINSLYSKDISRKVSTALRTQMQAGTFKSRNLPYGYMWNEDKSQIIIDEETAPFIKMIFQWKIEGVTIALMCKRLNDLDAPNTEFRKRQNGVRNGDGDNMEGWYKNTIHGMLKNQIYVGDTVLGKCEQALYKGLEQRMVKDSSKLFIFHNTHQAIISREDFEIVQNIMAKTSETLKTKMKETDKIRAKMVNLFENKIICADCGSKMYFRKHKLDYSGCKVVKEVWHASYNCSTNVRRLTPKCTPHNIQQKHLEEKVLSAIKTQVKVALDYEKLLIKLKDSDSEKSIRDKQNALVSSLNLKLNGLQNKRTRLYEDFSDGILTEKEYIFAKASFDDDFNKLNLILEETIQRKNSFNDAMSSNNKWIKLMKSVSGAKKLTQTLVDKSIENILVYEGGDIEIVMKYCDVFKLMVDGINQVKSEVVA